jgi:hypothetical protein
MIPMIRLVVLMAFGATQGFVAGQAVEQGRFLRDILPAGVAVFGAILGLVIDYLFGVINPLGFASGFATFWLR